MQSDDILKNQQCWNSFWGKIRNTEEQEKRKQRACQPEYTPLHMSKDYCNIGILNTYVTSLSSCSCKDFQRRQKPCKHMYRYAHECGAYRLEYPVVRDAYIHMKVRQDDALRMLDNLTIYDLQVLISVYEKCGDYHRNAPNMKIKKGNSSIKKLIDKGLVEMAAPFECVADISMDDLRSFVRSHKDFEKQVFHNKSEAVDFVIKNKNNLNPSMLKSSVYDFVIPGHRVEHLVTFILRKARQVVRGYENRSNSTYRLSENINYSYNDNDAMLNKILATVIPIGIIAFIILIALLKHYYF